MSFIRTFFLEPLQKPLFSKTLNEPTILQSICFHFWVSVTNYAAALQQLEVTFLSLKKTINALKRWVPLVKVGDVVEKTKHTRNTKKKDTFFFGGFWWQSLKKSVCLGFRNCEIIFFPKRNGLK